MSPSARRTWVCLAALAAVLALARLHTYDEPLERDLTTYAVIGHEMLGGRSLYADVWDHKPPAVHVTYSLTSMGCPVGPLLEQQITEAVAEMPGVEKVESELTWDPPWTPEKMSDDAKFILGFG